MPGFEHTFEDKERFVKEHAEEINSVAPDPTVVERVRKQEPIGESELDSAIEAFGNKLYTMEKREHDPTAQSILLTLDNPGSWHAMAPIITELERDPRCRAISAITGGFASEVFQKEFGGHFTEVKDNDALFLTDLDTLMKRQPVDIMLASGSAQNGPESVPLYSGKSVFGARKVFYLVDAWGLQPQFDDGAETRERRDKWLFELDGFFCNDELAKDIIREKLPDVPAERIFVTGTPVLESLETEKAGAYRAAGRMRFKLPSDAFVVLYIGDQSADYARLGIQADPDINEKTFTKTIAAYARCAEAMPKKRFALLLRPHPRDGKHQLPELAARAAVPSNLSVHLAPYPEVPLNEASYAADAIASIASTENFLAPLRGRRALYLAFSDEPGLGEKAVDYYVGAAGKEAIRRQAGGGLVSNESELAAAITKFSESEPLAPKTELTSGSARRILDVMLSNRV